MRDMSSQFLPHACIEGDFRLNMAEGNECFPGLSLFVKVASIQDTDDSTLLLTNLGHAVGVAVNDSDSDGAFP